MSALASRLRTLRRDTRGAMLVETAIVAPTLLLMSLGVFQVSGVVARQNELQNAADIAAEVAITQKPTTTAQLTTLQSVITSYTGLSASHVTLSYVYRCGTGTSYLTSSSTCAANYSTYVRIVLTDTYTPYWKKIGFGKPLNFSVTRQAITTQS